MAKCFHRWTRKNTCVIPGCIATREPGAPLGPNERMHTGGGGRNAKPKTAEQVELEARREARQRLMADLLSPAEASVLLGVPRDKLYKLRRSGQLEAVEVGGWEGHTLVGYLPESVNALMG